MSTIKSSKLKAEILEPTVKMDSCLTILSGFMSLDDSILEKSQALMIVEKLQEQLDIIKKYIIRA